MSNNKKLLFISGVILIMLAFVWFSSGTPSGKKYERTFVSSNWNKKFQPFDKDPLGLYLFNTLAQSHIKKSKDVYQVDDWKSLKELMNSGNKKKTFLFVGNIFGLDNFEIDSILSSVSRGSDFFLSYNETTSNIMRRLFKMENGNLKYDLQMEYSVSVNVFTDKLKCEMINIYQNDTIAREWNAFGEDIEPKGPFKSLSSFMQMDNFIEIKIGKGKVYLHTNPAMFYNYQIKRKSGFKYTEYVLNQISQDQDILLLELARLSDDYGKHNVDEQDGGEGKEDTSFLKVIFENPMLLAALILSIFGLILFVIFRSKRVRPVVPYKEDSTNMTLAFAETITSIYFAKRNPFGLLQVQRKNFYATIQKHFFVDLQRREDDKTLMVLAEKTNKSFEEIKSIVDKFETKEAFSVNDGDIAKMQQIQRNFYKDVGIIPAMIESRLESNQKIFRRILWLPTLLILSGVSSIFFGLYLLVEANGVGILLWPIGIALLALGVIRLSNPFIKVKDGKITYYTSLGFKKVYSLEELIGSEMKESGVILKFTNNRKLIINYWDLSRFDRNDFNHFIAKLHILEL